MKLKKATATILCAALLLSLLAGCGNSDDGSNTESDEPDNIELVPETPAVDQAPAHSEGIDFDAAINSFPPDTIMIRVGDITMTWAQLYVFFYGTIAGLVYSYNTGIEWSEEVDGSNTLADMLLEHMTEEALSFMVIEYGAKQLGITFSEEDNEMLNEDLEDLLEMYGGVETLEEALREGGGFYSFEVFKQLLKIEYTMGLIMTELYGNNAESFPDDRVSEFAQKNGYMMAKHILISKEAHDEDEALSMIEDILSQLQARVGDDDFPEFFDELMHEYSEDPGALMSFPEGYLFQPNDMVLPFSMACLAMQPGELSDIVESDFGHHIILRLPIDYDQVPISMASAGMARTLRQLAAVDDFEIVTQEWRDSLNPEFTPEYNSIDLATIFKWH